ncbi:MAG: PD40 domain-containing protein [Acidobacteria bacterium]|nr:PD40 domain-containing protein [Acidobacteriota bacterium]
MSEVRGQSNPGGITAAPLDPHPDACRDELARILADHRFANSPSLSRFLSYIVSQSLDGNPGALKETLLGVDVFGRGSDFDPRLDPIVRVQATKLRNKLHEYYQHEGASNPFRIEVPKGSYQPRFFEHTSPPPQPPQQPPPAAPHRSRLRYLIPTLAAVLIAAAALALRNRPQPAPPLTLTRLTYHEGSTTFPVISRDGRWLAYSSDQGDSVSNIWLQPISGGEARQLTNHRAATLAPDFSPDARHIVFQSRRDGGIHILTIDSGLERKIADRAWHPRFSPDGNWISCLGAKAGFGGRLLLIPSSGGGSHELPTANVGVASAPIWSPDGKSLLFLGEEPTPSGPQLDWYLMPWSGGQPVPLHLREALAAQSLPPPERDTIPGDWLGDSIYLSIRRDSSANIWRVPVLPANRLGALLPITSGAAVEAFPRLSANGQIVFVSEQHETYVFSMPPGPTGALTRVTSEPGTPYRLLPALSANGRKLAYTSAGMGSLSLHIEDLETKHVDARIPLQQLIDRPLLSPDGATALFRYTAGDHRLWTVSSSSAQPLAESGPLHQWSADGRHILAENPARTRLELTDWQTRRSTPWLDYPQQSLAQAALSPDSRRMLLVFPNVGAFLVPFHPSHAPARHEWITLPDDPTADTYYWTPTSDALFFFSRRDGHRCLWSYEIETQTPAPVRHFHTNRLSPWSGWLALAPGKVFLTLTTPKANLWLATLR